MKKLKKSTWPTGHGPNDFKCFGPPATKDGEFEENMICDMGCFTQDGKDSNKYYHAAVTQSKINNLWYPYFEYGRVGATNPQFQFHECSSKEEAQKVYAKQLHAKNDRRGEWITIAGIKTLRAKKGKDCYLVRPQATRATGLPNAKTIVTDVKVKQKKSKKEQKAFDPESLSLLKDLNIGAIEYTRSSMANAALPTLDAIKEARDILEEATKIIKKNYSNDLEGQSNSKELEQLTGFLYSRIPKKKAKKATKSEWNLTEKNIDLWIDDLDAYETALDATTVESTTTKDYPFFIEHLSRGSSLGKFICNFMNNGTRNVHGGVGRLNIKNIWKITHDSNLSNFQKYRKSVNKTCREKPLHQVDRIDIEQAEIDENKKSHTFMLFHGTRSVNVGSILNTTLRVPNLNAYGMFGPGIYWADDWKKSAGYCSMNGAYWSRGKGGLSNRHAFMFIGDVVLGNMWVAPRSTRKKHGPEYHSTFGKMNKSGVMNNEFIVFTNKALYLRYLVEFNT